MEKPYLELGPEEIDEIIAMTTDGGPIEEDLFYLIFAGDRFWRVGMFEAENIFEWFAKFPDFDFEKSIRASTCTENRRFILWSKTGPRGIGEKTSDELTLRLTDLLMLTNEHWGMGSADRLQSEKIAQQVTARYREPHRQYHGLAHIKHCLWELDQVPENLLDSNGPQIKRPGNRTKIELAIWFHDVIYDPRSKTNEHDSAQFFVSSLAVDSGTSLSQVKNAERARAVEEISEMIELSNHRQPVSDNRTALAYFLDIDMAILGRPEIHYGEYAQNVRLEYEHVPSLVYSHYRKKFLNAILKHGAFQTELFKAKYMKISNANLRSEFEHLHPRWIPPWKMVEF